MQPNSFRGTQGQKEVLRLVQFLERKLISLDECLSNVLWTIVATEESAWNDCLAVIPRALLPKLHAFARSYLLPVDFMPHPGVALPLNSPEAQDLARQQFRPLYIKLLELIENSSSQE
jgi:hypothetical protein